MRFIFMLFLSFGLIFGSDTIDGLLLDIELKDDLSEKTKKANNGIVTVITRSDLNMMNAKHLRDILKTTEIGYKISRYGLVDPNMKGFSPFASSTIRVYIDNQEISSSLYGSGLTILGDIDLGFVDHIEIYTANPSFEFVTEPTQAMIKLYSKRQDRDPDTTMNYSASSYNSNNISLNNSNKIGDYSYFLHISEDNDNKKRSFIDNQEISRDTNRRHSFLSLYNNDRRFMVSKIDVDKDSFLGIDWEGDTSKSDMQIDTLHVGYDEKFGNDISLHINYDSMIDNSVFENDNILFLYQNDPTKPIDKFEVNGNSKVITSKLQQKRSILKHDILYGIKYRYKDLKYDSLKLNGNLLTYKGITRQDVKTFYMQDNYNLSPNSIFTIATQYSDIDNANHDGIKDDTQSLFRVGNTYTNGNIMYQTYLYYQEVAIEPYLVNSIYLENDDIKKERRKSFLEKITYTNNSHIFDIIYTYDNIKDAITTTSMGAIKNSSTILNCDSILLRWTHNYSDVNKHFISYLKTDVNQKIVLKNFNRYRKLDMYQEFMVDKVDDEIYYDLSLSASYEYNNNLNINLRCENILNKAYEQKFMINSTTTVQPLDPYMISIIDRKITLSLEYTF